MRSCDVLGSRFRNGGSAGDGRRRWYSPDEGSMKDMARPLLVNCTAKEAPCDSYWRIAASVCPMG